MVTHSRATRTRNRAAKRMVAGVWWGVVEGGKGARWLEFGCWAGEWL